MRRLICLFIALPLLLPAQETELSFRATSSEVLLDVVVRDKKDHIVRNLKPEEVQVLEDGVPQKLRRFEFFDGHAPTEASPLQAAANASASPLSAPNAPAQPLNVQELRDISMVSVVIAELDQRGRKFTLDTMREFIKNELRPNVYVGVFTLDEFAGLHRIQPYTNDNASISAAMERVVRIAYHETSKTSGQDSRSFGSDTSLQAPISTDQLTTTQANSAQTGPAQLINQITENNVVTSMEDVYQGSMRFLSSMHALVQSQARIPGRKVILLFSGGLPVHYDTVESLQNVISTANRANVTVYAVDTRSDNTDPEMMASLNMMRTIAATSARRQMGTVNGGDQTIQPMEVAAPEWTKGVIHADVHGNLRVLAESTGGALLSNSDLRGPLRRAMEEVETHYELSYAPANSAMDGRFRKIEVKVSRPGVMVFARSGYYAVPTLNGRQLYPFEMATLKAINTKPQLRQFEFHDAVFQFRPGTGSDQLAFAFEAQAHDLSILKDKDWNQVHVSVTALIKNDHGQVVEKISKDIPYEVPAAQSAELQRGVVTFTSPFLLPPGRYTVETAAIDRESMKASVQRSSLVVEPSTGLAMSDIAVVRRLDTIHGESEEADPLETKSAKVTPELLDVISPEADKQVRFYAIAYPPTPVDAPVQVSMEIWRNGQMVVRTPESEVPSDATGAASMLAGIPLEKLPAGQYEAQITFGYKGQKVSKVTTFAVGAGS